MRLALHECDPNKNMTSKCASREETDLFFRNNIIVINMKTVQPNLRNYEENGSLTTTMKDVHYATREQTDLTWGKQIFFKQSRIEVDDDIVGLNDTPLELDFLEYIQSVRTTLKPSKSDPLNKHTDMLQFWNMLLTEDQSYYERIRYKMLEIMGEVGGLMAVLMPLMWVIMYPATYKIHHISVYKEYMEH